MSDFIIESDEDEEMDIPDEQEVIFSHKKMLVSEEAIRLMPNLLPSTMMKVCSAALIFFNTWLTPLAVCDGGPHGGHREAPRAESMLPHSNLYVSLLTLLLQTLVISQWAGCLFLVSDYLIEKGIVHVK